MRVSEFSTQFPKLVVSLLTRIMKIIDNTILMPTHLCILCISKLDVFSHINVHIWYNSKFVYFPFSVDGLVMLL